MSESVRTAFREQARKRFLELLRARYWPLDEERSDKESAAEILDASDAVEDLAQRALDEYRAVREETLDRGLDPPQSPSFLLPERRAARGIETLVSSDRLARLDAQVDDWTQRWNLQAEWCVDVAFRSLDLWSRSPEALARFEWMHRDTGFGVGRVSFVVDEWSRMEPLAEYRKAAAIKLQDLFAGYCESLEGEASRDEIPTVATARTPEAFRWTVQAQVLGQPLNQIADDATRDASTVKRAVDDVLQHVGLQQRPRSRGRTPGSKNRHTVRRRE